MLPGRLEYFYLIRHKPSGKFYAGSKYSQNCHPDQFWNISWRSKIGRERGYFTSSGTVKALIEADGLDSFEVLEVIPRPLNDAYDYEISFLKSVKAKTQSNWINETDGTANFCRKGPMSADHKYKIGLALKTSEAAIQQRTKMNANKIGIPRSPEVRAKLSAGNKGKPSPKRKVECPHCGKIGGVNVMHEWHFNKCKLLQT